MLDDLTKANLAFWNELTDVHRQSAYYDLAGFKAGKQSLGPIELAELGPDVAGKTLLHLQCHFGMDTLSLARLGATVTGIDFSDKAIALARSLSDELSVPARFIESSVYDLPTVLAEQFDIVFTSWGVLIWLPDIRRWAEIVARYLKPGGTFYIAEIHPFLFAMDDDESVRDPRVRYPYFERPEPMAFDTDGSYADRSAHIEQSVSYEWRHSLSEIVSSLAATGLHIEYLHEFPYTQPGLDWAFLEEGEDGWARVRGHPDDFPLSFSIKAVKDRG
jgi:2-polyprenyl-3-methyl-5-hydroxy-6-metoxy-1,4-benzoquinol methylase